MDLSNQILGGRYRIVSPVREGGFGSVWLAKGVADGKDYAIKMLSRESASKKEHVDRFRREYEILKRLEHPHIVRAYEFDRVADGEVGIPWFSMDYYPLDLAAMPRGPESRGERLAVILQVLDALEFAHDRDIRHRDLKPANILVSTAGRAVLADFGIARDLDRKTRLTRTGSIVGTPKYFSPEQCEGSEVAPASDIYSIGVILFEICAGELPFKPADQSSAMDWSLIEKHLTVPAPEPRSLDPTISDELNACILKCLEKDPADRHASAGELKRALERCPELGEASLALAPGAIVRGAEAEYEVLGLISRQGGFAEVYKVRAAGKPGVLALKIIRPELARDVVVVRRFEREIAILSKELNHANIVSALDSGRHPAADGRAIPFFIMRYFPGDLGRALKLGVDPVKTFPILIHILRALHHAHRVSRPVYHRDLKPANILISGNGDGYLADFGIAAHASTEVMATKITANFGELPGTPEYMSPEQINSDLLKGGELDGRSDIYSFGVILYEVLCGRRPFTGKNPHEIFYKHIKEAPAPPRSLNPVLSRRMEEVVLKCLEKDRDRRFQNVRDLMEELLDLKHGAWRDDGAPTPALPARALTAVFGALRRPAFYAAGAAGAGAFLAAAYGGGEFLEGQAEARRDRQIGKWKSDLLADVDERLDLDADIAVAAMGGVVDVESVRANGQFVDARAAGNLVEARALLPDIVRGLIPSPTPTPPPTLTPPPSAVPTEPPKPARTVTLPPTSTATPTPSKTPGPTPKPSDTPTASPTPSPRPTSPSPTPPSTPTPVPTVTAPPTKTTTPEPTTQPMPMPEPVKSEMPKPGPIEAKVDPETRRVLDDLGNRLKLIKEVKGGFDPAISKRMIDLYSKDFSEGANKKTSTLMNTLKVASRVIQPKTPLVDFSIDWEKSEITLITNPDDPVTRTYKITVKDGKIASEQLK